MLADALLTGRVLYRSLQYPPLESSCVVVALIENYSSSKPLKVSPEKSQILSCDTVVANGRYICSILLCRQVQAFWCNLLPLLSGMSLIVTAVRTSDLRLCYDND
jgi:hypothetical protein